MKPSVELLERCRHDDRKAHHELYGMCFPVIYSISSRYYINKEDRISALNMIFVKLVQKMNDYLRKKEEVEFEYWMRRVSINYIIDEFRRQKRYREMVSLHEDGYDYDHAVSADADLRYDREEIQKAISQLPPASRAVFNLYAVDGYKHEEIAGLLGISIGTSKSHLFKARKKLQEALADLKKKAPLNNALLP
jgi:RNA polymerase sigma-70 factor (ECF subfamily)